MSGEGRLTAEDAARFAQCIADGGVALFPSDTVYGLACDPLRPRAVQRLYELKGRPPAQPAAVMFFALAPALAALPELGPRTRATLTALLPGPLTVLLPNPRDRFPLACRPGAALPDGLPGPLGRTTASPGGTPGPLGRTTASPGGTPSPAGEAALGLRVPLLAPALAALGAVKAPVLQSSANLSGGPEARRVADVAPALRAGADLVLDGGELPGVASTVLDLREYEAARRWQIVREGPLDRASLARSIGSC